MYTHTVFDMQLKPEQIKENVRVALTANHQRTDVLFPPHSDPTT